jgi:hypothetical protein
MHIAIQHYSDLKKKKKYCALKNLIPLSKATNLDYIVLLSCPWCVKGRGNCCRKFTCIMKGLLLFN